MVEETSKKDVSVQPASRIERIVLKKGFTMTDKKMSWKEFETANIDDDEDSGFVLVCKPKGHIDGDDDVSVITLPLSRSLTLRILSAVKKTEWLPDQMKCVTDFLRKLAASSDAEYRLAAAQSVSLSAEIVETLLQDAAHDVRQAVASNPTALSRITAKQRLTLSSSEDDIRSAVLQSALDYWLWYPISEEESERSKNDAREIAEATLTCSSPNLVDLADYVIDILNNRKPSPIKREDKEAVLYFGWTIRVPSQRYEAAYAAADKWTFELLDNSSEEVALRLPLPSSALKELAENVSTNTQEEADLLHRLAQSPDSAFRSKIADRENLPAEIYEVLASDREYAVRKALLTNSSALEVLAKDQIKRLAQNDPILLKESFEQTDNETILELMHNLVGPWCEEGDAVLRKTVKQILEESL